MAENDPGSKPLKKMATSVPRNFRYDHFLFVIQNVQNFVMLLCIKYSIPVLDFQPFYFYFYFYL